MKMAGQFPALLQFAVDAQRVLEDHPVLTLEK